MTTCPAHVRGRALDKLGSPVASLTFMSDDDTVVVVPDIFGYFEADLTADDTVPIVYTVASSVSISYRITIPSAEENINYQIIDLVSLPTSPELSLGPSFAYLVEDDVNTNLGIVSSATSITITSSTGDDATILAANGTNAGVLTSTKSLKLDGIQDGATANQTDAYLLNTDHHTAGLTNSPYSLAEKSKLSLIQAGATQNFTDAFLLARSNHTGTESADVLTDGTTNKAFLATERTKLTGIQTGAQVNVATDLGLGTRTASTLPITSSTGLGVSLPLATSGVGGLAGIMSTADKAKLDAIIQAPRVVQLSASTGNIDLSVTDVAFFNSGYGAGTKNITTTNTMLDGRELQVRFQDAGVSRALTFSTSFVWPAGFTTPTTTPGSITKELHCWFVYSANLNKLVASRTPYTTP